MYDLIITFKFILTNADHRHEKKENHQIARHENNFFVIVRYLLNCLKLMHVAS